MGNGGGWAGAGRLNHPLVLFGLAMSPRSSGVASFHRLVGHNLGLTKGQWNHVFTTSIQLSVGAHLL